jgi:integrase
VGGVVKKLGEQRYYIATRIPTSAGPNTQFKRSGFTRRKDAEAALDRIAELLAIPRVNDHATRARIGDLIVSSTRRGGRLPDVVEVRRRYGANMDPTATAPTVGEFLDGWVAGRRRIRETTRAAHRGCINTYLRPHLGDVPLDALSKTHIDDMVSAIIASGRLSPASLYQVFAVLRAALNTAFKQRLIAFNPCVQVELPEIPRTERPVWTPAQALAFLDNARDDRHVVAYRIVLLAGLRRGEVAALRWADVDWDAGSIRVERGLVYLHGELTEQPTKTGRTRVVALDAETMEALWRHRKAQAAERLAAATAYRDGDWIFARADGTPTHPKTLGWRFQVLAREAGLPVIHLHDGRHTSATFDLLAGVDVKIVSKRLGHARTAITQDTYQHVLDGLQEQAAERRAALLAHPTATREAGS